MAGFSHDLIWGALCKTTDVKESCHDLIWNAMWIGNNVTGSFLDQFQVLCGLYQMKMKLSWPNLRWYVYWKRYEWKVSRPIWGSMSIGTDDKEWCHDLIWGAMLIGTDDKRHSHDLIWSATLIRKDVTERFDDQLERICDLKSCETMMSWPNLRWYVVWKESERRFHD
jgi:hypothetical protein